MTKIVNAYARGLYDLAGEENLTETVLEQLQVLQTAFDREPMFCRLLSTPNLTREERLSVLDRSLRGKVHPYVLHFLKLLTERGYASSFSECCRAYRNYYNEDNDILPVTAVSAVPLTQAQTGKLTAKLHTITGKTVELRNQVDPACLGGVCLDYDGKRVDGTVKSRLDALAKTLRG